MASMFDAKSYKIPNELIILGYTAGFYLNIQSFQLIVIILFIIKAALPILLLHLLFLAKGLGAGDIKLLSAMCTLVGINVTVDVMITSVMLAGIAVLFLYINEKGINLKRRLHYSFYITAAFFLLNLCK